MAKKTAYFGMFIALAFIFSYIETLLPINVGIYGVKLGLANLVIIVAFYLIGFKQACLLSIVRIVLVSFTFGNMAAMVYSMGGAILSLLAMWISKRTRLFSVSGVSLAGGVFHNVGQLIIAMIVVDTTSLVYYLPVLVLAGSIAGVLIGIAGGLIIKRVEKILVF